MATVLLLAKRLKLAQQWNILFQSIQTRIPLNLTVMAENKKSFILYCDLIHTVEKLPAEKAGELFLHILKYVNDQNPITDDIIIQIAFEPIRQQLKRDLQHWKSICSKRSESGKLGGRPKKQTKAKKANAFSEKQMKAKKADNDTVNDTDNDTVNVKEEINSVVDEYNKTNFPKLKVITEMRKNHLRARLKENGVEAVKAMIQKANMSKFLHGFNERGWKADFDWLMNPNNYAKVVEGKYENKPERMPA